MAEHAGYFIPRCLGPCSCIECRQAIVFSGCARKPGEETLKSKLEPGTMPSEIWCCDVISFIMSGSYFLYALGNRLPCRLSSIGLLLRCDWSTVGLSRNGRMQHNLLIDWVVRISAINKLYVMVRNRDSYPQICFCQVFCFSFFLCCGVIFHGNYWRKPDTHVARCHEV